MAEDHLPLRGEVAWELRGPDGELTASGVSQNIITELGDEMYGERGAGVAGAPAAPTGMKLGTGGTAPSKNGAGAALTTYLANSHQAFANTPTGSLSAGKRRITYTGTWASGKATTTSPITEAVIVNDPLANATSAAGATVSRVLLSGIPAKTAADTLTLTWTHDLGS